MMTPNLAVLFFLIVFPYLLPMGFCSPVLYPTRYKRAVFDMIPPTQNIAPTSLPRQAPGAACRCPGHHQGFLCVLDMRGRCRRTLTRGGRKRRRRGLSFRIKRRHSLEKLRRRFQLWLSKN